MRNSVTKVVALAFAMASLSPVAGMAATKAAAKPKATIVSGKVVAVDALLSMVTLSNGQTYKITDSAKFKAMKVGKTVKLKMAEKKA